MRTRNLIALSALAIALLTAASTVAIGAARHGFDTSTGRYGNSGTTCTVPSLPGAVVNVSVTNMGGPMTGGPGMGGGVRGGMTTITLAPGRYELVCNLPGHYAAGMYTQLTVQ